MGKVGQGLCELTLNQMKRNWYPFLIASESKEVYTKKCLMSNCNEQFILIGTVKCYTEWFKGQVKENSNR